MTNNTNFEDDDLFEDENQNNDWNGPPLFQNNGIGVSAWPNKDKNGNWYLTISIPLLNNINLFANTGAHEGLESTWNKFVENFQ